MSYLTVKILISQMAPFYQICYFPQKSWLALDYLYKCGNRWMQSVAQKIWQGEVKSWNQISQAYKWIHSHDQSDNILHMTTYILNMTNWHPTHDQLISYTLSICWYTRHDHFAIHLLSPREILTHEYLGRTWRQTRHNSVQTNNASDPWLKEF